MPEVMSQKEIEMKLKAHIQEEIDRSANIKDVDNVIFELFDTDTWGEIPVYKADGHILCQVKTGIFSSKQGKKGFSAKVDARTGKILAFNWKPGEQLH